MATLTRLPEPVPRASEFRYTRWTPCGEVVELPPAINTLGVDLVKLSEQRRTRYGGIPLEREQLSSILWLTAKTLSQVSPDERQLHKFKPVVSGGAKHPIWLLTLEGLRDRLCAYFYDDGIHALRRAELGYEEPCRVALERALASCRSPDGTLLIFAADWRATHAKYENPESVLWRDAGALLQQFALVSSAMNLNCVPMGHLGEALLQQVHGAESLVALGGCLLSSPAD